MISLASSVGIASDMIVVGIVGTPAGGKSTVAARLKELGAEWINADLIAREVLGRAEIQRQVLEYFGSSMALENGEIDRALLAAAVFGDVEENRQALRYLESVVHPPTRREITVRLREAAERGCWVAVLDVPLLLEANWDVCCDEIWSVDSPWADRLQRAQGRGWDADELKRREANQLTISEKNRLSNLQITNDSSLADLHSTVNERWEHLLECKRKFQANFPFQHCLTDRRAPQAG